jgi:hypothetical protein
MDDHDRLTVVETEVRLDKEQHERDIKRLAGNINAVLAIVAIFVTVMGIMILYK